MSNYLNNLFNLNGKVVLLTGSGGHLVSEMARSCGMAGMNVVCTDFKLETAQKTMHQIIDNGGDAIAIQVDVTNKADHEKALKLTIDSYGKLDYVLNGAGSNAPTPFFDINVDEWNNILAVQLTGTMLSCQVFGKYMIDQKYGSIINISSASSVPPL